MPASGTTYVLGAGAIGFPLVAFITHAGRHAVAVRTSVTNLPSSTTTVEVELKGGTLRATVETISLARLTRIEGLVVITAKSHANEAIAQELQRKAFAGPIVVMQNGIGVERPFLERLSGPVYRCVLYATSQAVADGRFAFRPVTASPTGIFRGTDAELTRSVKTLSTDEFPLRVEGDIRRAIWKKTIVNAVFNSICPLLDVDNGVFVRDDEVAGLARQLVRECLAVTRTLGLDLDEPEVMDQIAVVSRHSDGQIISTLQDIRQGRPTEMEFLNLEIARIARATQPTLDPQRIELLGRLVVAKSFLSRNRSV